MEYTKRDGDASLFVNDRKETEKQPDYKGSLFLNGKDYWVNGWAKTSQSGKKWISMSVQPKEPKEQIPHVNVPQPTGF